MAIGIAQEIKAKKSVEKLSLTVESTSKVIIMTFLTLFFTRSPKSEVCKSAHYHVDRLRRGALLM